MRLDKIRSLFIVFVLASVFSPMLTTNASDIEIESGSSAICTNPDTVQQEFTTNGVKFQMTVTPFLPMHGA